MSMEMFDGPEFAKFSRRTLHSDVCGTTSAASTASETTPKRIVSRLPTARPAHTDGMIDW